jgi:hypothetical protein
MNHVVRIFILNAWDHEYAIRAGNSAGLLVVHPAVLVEVSIVFRHEHDVVPAPPKGAGDLQQRPFGIVGPRRVDVLGDPDRCHCRRPAMFSA